MDNNEKLYEAARLLKENCNKLHIAKPLQYECKECVFNDNGICSLCNHTPFAWEIKTPKHWTDSDIMWAKAAKSSGATEICKTTTGAPYAEMPDTTNAVFPANCFKHLEPGFTVSIDGILEEGQE